MYNVVSVTHNVGNNSRIMSEMVKTDISKSINETHVHIHAYLLAHRNRTVI